ncbi:MAG: hypothetical protein H8E98_06170 [Bacteroidetes bacterium]|nr:hypothetical protein [Bacteroidota bacterium]
MIVKESNASIDSLIKELDRRIIELKKNKILTPEVQNELLMFYEKMINPWIEKYFFQDKFQLNEEDEELFINSVLDVLNSLKKLKIK